MSAISFGYRLPSFPPSPSSLQNTSKAIFKHFPHPPTTKDPVIRVPSCTSKQGEPSPSSSSAVLDKNVPSAVSDDKDAPGRRACVEGDSDEDDKRFREAVFSESSMVRSSSERASKELLVIRRPVMDTARDEDPEASGRIGEGEESVEGVPSSSSSVASYEPKVSGPESVRGNLERPLRINLELALYRAKVLARNYQFDDAEKLLRQRAVQASPKNRFAWHVWALYEVKQGNIDKGRKLLKVGHALNRRDPVLLQSLALLEYKHSSANLARELFKRAADIDPKHQPVWTAWGWMEWKEGNISTARKLYQKALSVDSTSENAARCLQAWGVLEQRVGNLTAARRLFRSSLNINSQSYVTWMTWASLEEQQGNAVRAEEIRNLYFQQRTEIVDDASWVMGFLDMIDPAVDSIKKLLKLNNSSSNEEAIEDVTKQDNYRYAGSGAVSISLMEDNNPVGNDAPGDFDVDAFIRDKLSLDPSQLEIPASDSQIKKIGSPRKIWKAPQSYSTPTISS